MTFIDRKLKSLTILLFAVLAVGLLLLTAPPARAQADPTNVGYAVNNPCKDPWVSLAVSLVRTNRYGPGRAFTGNGQDGECNIQNYNGGHWSHYAELVGYVTAYFRTAPNAAATAIGVNNPCSDPWVSYAVSFYETAGGAPKAGRAVGSGGADECAPKLYNGGQWSSYGQLLDAVKATQTTMWNDNLRFQYASSTNTTPTLVLINPKQPVGSSNDPAVLLLTSAAQVGGNIVAQGGGNIVAQGGGNLIAQNASIVAQGGGNIVAQGGGNIANRQSFAGAAKATVLLPSGLTLFVH